MSLQQPRSPDGLVAIAQVARLANGPNPAPPDPGPFGIDGPEFSDRDREMFCLGFEYADLKRDIEWSAVNDGKPIYGTIHEANVDRLVAVAEGFDLKTKIHILRDGWARIRVER